MIGLILLSPLLLLIALVIKLDSPGPVLYRQRRIGKNKHLFEFIKFRTMYTHLSVGEAYGGEQAKQLYEQLIDSEQNVREGVLSKIQDDPRVTRVGRWLRTTSLDELPSLWLVLVGKMSLVGPRPHMPHEVDQYDPWQERLFSIKPGITGYAQLFGRDQLPFDEEAKLDLWYIQNWSLLLDVYILVSTVKVVLRGH
jgi:lipopolysaccharide/colanic/teichoic acid biosynthesis glycosyltransferase